MIGVSHWDLVSGLGCQLTAADRVSGLWPVPGASLLMTMTWGEIPDVLESVAQFQGSSPRVGVGVGASLGLDCSLWLGRVWL